MCRPCRTVAVLLLWIKDMNFLLILTTTPRTLGRPPEPQDDVVALRRLVRPDRLHDLVKVHLVCREDVAFRLRRAEVRAARVADAGDADQDVADGDAARLRRVRALRHIDDLDARRRGAKRRNLLEDDSQGARERDLCGERI